MDLEAGGNDNGGFGWNVGESFGVATAHAGRKCAQAAVSAIVTEWQSDSTLNRSSPSHSLDDLESFASVASRCFLY